MEMMRDADIDPSPLAGKRVAILGYGNQGRAQALNLYDSGIDVVVGLRGGSGSSGEAEAAGLQVAVIEDAVRSADVIMLRVLSQSQAAGEALIFRENSDRIQWGQLKLKLSRENDFRSLAGIRRETG